MDVIKNTRSVNSQIGNSAKHSQPEISVMKRKCENEKLCVLKIVHFIEIYSFTDGLTDFRWDLLFYGYFKHTEIRCATIRAEYFTELTKSIDLLNFYIQFND